MLEKSRNKNAVGSSVNRPYIREIRKMRESLRIILPRSSSSIKIRVIYPTLLARVLALEKSLSPFKQENLAESYRRFRDAMHNA